MAISLTIVDFEIKNNVWWTDILQLGCSDDTSWDINNKSFHMALKVKDTDTTVVLLLSTADSTIVVDDPVQRIIHVNVTDTAIRAALTAGSSYVYDLVMIDDITSERNPICQGSVAVLQGVTVT
jgi:hypothetical protein